MDAERRTEILRDLMHRYIHDGARRLEDDRSGGILATYANGQATRAGGGGTVRSFAELAGDISHGGRTVTVSVVDEGNAILIDDPLRHHAMDDSNVPEEVSRWIDDVPTSEGLHVIAGGRLSGRRTTLGFAIRRFLSQGRTMRFVEDPSGDVPEADVIVHGLVAGLAGLDPLARIARTRPVLVIADESFREDAFALAGRRSTDIFWLSQTARLGEGGEVRLTAVASELRP